MNKAGLEAAWTRCQPARESTSDISLNGLLTKGDPDLYFDSFSRIFPGKGRSDSPPGLKWGCDRSGQPGSEEKMLPVQRMKIAKSRGNRVPLLLMLACFAAAPAAFGEPSASPQREQDGVASRPRSNLPIITSLSKKEGNWSEVVAINGENFIGPFDRGYNVVFFALANESVRIKVAPIAVWQNKIWAIVPQIAPGPVKIRVQTQYGASNAVDFLVKRPSWHF